VVRAAPGGEAGAQSQCALAAGAGWRKNHNRHNEMQHLFHLDETLAYYLLEHSIKN
jgi:hypothetical protein